MILGNGDGSFEPRVDYPAGENPLFVAIGDLNGDGRPDLAVTNAIADAASVIPNFNDSSVGVFRGNGDGQFQPRVDHPTGRGPYFVAIDDLNGDGHADLAVVSYHDNLVGVLLGNGDGTFRPRVDHRTGSGPYSVAAGDLNGDGRPDLVVANRDGDTVSVLLGLCGGVGN